MRVLGGFSVRRAGRVLALRPSVRRLVAFLAIEGPTERGDVAVQLFESATEVRALGSLRTVLWRLRSEAPGLVSESRDYLELSGVEMDLAPVLAWCDSVLDGGDPASHPPRGCGQSLLPYWDDWWATQAREHVHIRQLYALEAAAERLLASGRPGEAASAALRAISMDPLRESAQRILIEMMLREGNAVDAMRRYRSFEDVLRREANAAPGVGLQALIAPVVASGVRVPPPGRRRVR